VCVHHNRKYFGTKEKCTCRASGANNYCGTCNVFQKLRDDVATIMSRDGLFVECTACKNRRVLQDFSCVPAAAASCPITKVLYIGEVTGSSCEEPFSCSARIRTSGTKIGEQCMCLDSDLCRDCSWGVHGHKCTTCKKFTVLLDGKCISQTECYIAGGFPILASSGPRGGVCRT
jgi:hypothetical protein